MPQVQKQANELQRHANAKSYCFAYYKTQSYAEMHVPDIPALLQSMLTYRAKFITKS